MPGLLSRLDQSLQLHSARPAVEGGHWVLSYRDLNLESERLAGALHEAGVRPGHVVPMLMGRSPEFVVAMLALLRCGAAYAPIDLSSPPLRRAAMLSVLDSPLVLVDGSAQASDTHGREPLHIDALLRGTRCATPRPWPKLPGDTPLYAMFTSGSTGAPKAVLVPHRAVERLVCAADYAELRAGARWAQHSSLAFDASTLELWAPLLNGGVCVVQEHPQPSLHELGEFMVRRRITDTWLTSALFNAMVDDQIAAFAGLRQLLTGGERVSVSHARACMAAWPRLRLINGYGPTENTTFSLCHTLSPDDLSGSALQIPIGRPIHGTLARVASPIGDELPVGEVGELWVAGDGVAIGYLDDAGLTEARFPWRDGLRWYRTGDQVRQRTDGVHEFLGRVDRQVKIAGHRIELEEVERALAACPGVGDVAVMVQGERADTRHLVGCYSGRDTASPDEATVHAWLVRQLPPGAVPGRLRRLQRLPIGINGKVDRESLLARLVSGEANVHAPLETEVQDTFATDTEQRLALLWKRLLPVAPRGRQANFMRCGGSSLLALRLASDIARDFGRHLDPLEVLRNPELADQARMIDAAAPMVRGDPPGPGMPGLVQLSRSMQTLVRASALDPSGAAYLVHVPLHLPVRVGPAALRLAFEALIQRHPILRTTVGLRVERVDAQLLQRLPSGWWTLRDMPFRLPADFEWPDALTPTVNRPLNLALEGPMRVDCWALPDRSALCVWTVHHFAIDEASIDQALMDLDQSLRGEDLAPAYGSPYAFAALERAAADESGLKAQAREVARVLPRQMPPLPLPPRHGAECELPLPPQTDAQLAQVCRAWECTAFAPLLVACALAQQQMFGEVWRFVLTPFSRRSEPELVEPIGCLLDVRLVEAGARPGEPLAATLARVHDELLQAQHLSFRSTERLAHAVEAAAPGVSSSLTQFAMTWRHDTQRARTLGGAKLRVLRVPQAGARFGLVLHLESTAHGVRARVEAVQQVIDDGRAQAFGRAFSQQLARVCASRPPTYGETPRSAALASRDRPIGVPVEASQRALAHAAWHKCLGSAPDGDDAHFLRCGGSSLLAMRMAAQLRRQGGLSIDIGAFLGRPTFMSLCQLLQQGGRAETGIVTLMGPHKHERVWLVLPGMLVGALGMFALSQELQSRLPADGAVAIVDTDAIMRRAPQRQRAEFFVQQLQQVVRDLGESRVAGVVGYSVGGVLGIELLNRMGRSWAARVPLWMLDTYAPHHTSQNVSTKARRALVSLLRHPADAPRLVARRLRERRHGMPAMPAMPEDTGQDLKPLWHAFLAELAGTEPVVADIHATLIHSRGAARSAGVWRHARSNGFDPSRFARLQLISLDCNHYDLRSSAAAQVADIVTGVSSSLQSRWTPGASRLASDGNSTHGATLPE